MSGHAPFFSVVIPVFNRADLLGRALDSVLAQDDRDFEILVVDDASTDDPNAVVDEPGDPRIRYLRLDRNAGGGAARNVGIEAALGDYVAFLDSDDAFLPHHLGAMRRLLSGTRDCAGYAQVFVDRGVGRTILKPPRALAEGEDMATYLLCDRGFVPTSTMVVPRAWAQRIRFPEHLRAAEDTDFAIRLALEGCRFLMADDPGTTWRDACDPNRTSADRGSNQLAEWLEAIRPRIPARAYYGCLGWAGAKQIVGRDRWTAFKHYVTALSHGAYRPSLAAIVFLQVFLPERLYRALADGAIAWLRAGFPAPERQAQRPPARGLKRA